MSEIIKVTSINIDMVDEAVDLFMQTFSKEPWNDVYESRNQVVSLFKNHMNNNYFVGYVGILNNKIVALCLGFKKPWLNGIEYYIDEFCVSFESQGCGIGTEFLNYIEADIERQGMNAIILNTESDYPAKAFYEKNGFKVLNEFVILAK